MSSVSKNSLLIGVALVAVAGVLLLGPIPQAPGYHDFADRRGFAVFPNLLNVISNLPLLLIGLTGLGRLTTGRLHVDKALRPAIAAVFAGVALTAVGSALYHLQPDNTSLVWDRLPMTLAFMGLVALVVGEYVDIDTGRLLLWPLLAAGVCAVLWWYYSERLGRGDLRFYGLVQFLPLVELSLVLLLYPPRWSRGADYWKVGGWYLAAKLFELFDRPVFQLAGVVSGHTLKHLAAAMAAWQLLHMLGARTRRQSYPVGSSGAGPPRGFPG